MARVELIIPKMGESVSEATIISWSKNVGDMIEMDETIIEIATDKVDSEVPSTHEGKLVEMLFQADDVVKVGETFAILETEGDIAAVIAAHPLLNINASSHFSSAAIFFLSISTVGFNPLV